MHDFRYVTKKQAQPIKDELYQILYMVQDLVRNNFTFSFTPIGSSSRNMITCDAKSNIGFDFDINIEVNDDNEDFEWNARPYSEIFNYDTFPLTVRK